MNSVIIIPAYEPTEDLLDFIIDLQALGLDRIVVVDDGSGARYLPIINSARSLGCVVVSHGANRGKGAAIRTGIETAREEFGDYVSVITADADGQHLAKDVLRVAETLASNPDSLILGVRDFSGEDVPRRSRFGNRFTSKVFHICNGIECPDTQTGLRGIPKSLTIMALCEDGDRYEYEMNFLMDAAGKVPFVFVPIETVYHDKDNSVSHFRPVMDSLRVYGRPLRFMASSLTGSAADYFLFFVFCSIFASLSTVETIFISTVLARLGSGLVNFIMNRHFSFRSSGEAGGELLRYSVLFVGQMVTSAALVSLMGLFMPALAAKLLIDTSLFFVSYVIQKKWVFGKGGEDHEAQIRQKPEKVMGRAV